MAAVGLLVVVVSVLCQTLFANLEPSDGCDQHKLWNADEASSADSKDKIKSIHPIKQGARGIPDFNRVLDSLLTSKSRYESILNSAYLQSDSRTIAQQLREVANEQLCTMHMQAALDVSPLSPTPPPPVQMVQQMSNRLESRVEHLLVALDKLVGAVADLHHTHRITPLNVPRPCCKMDPQLLKFDSHFDLAVSKDSACDLLPHSLPNNSFLPGINLTSVFRDNLAQNSLLKWQYFMSTDGVHTEYPAYMPLVDFAGSCRHELNHRHREVYLQTVHPWPKQVVLVLDHGSGMSLFQLLMAKVIGNYILSTLSHNDKVGLIGLANEVQFPQSCHPQQMASATQETKFHLSRFIDGLQRSQEPANHLLGFQKAFEMLNSVLDSNNTSEALILYISRGLLSSIADAKVILENIAHDNRKSGNRVIINTYMILEEGKPVMYEKTFLQDIANQNFSKYHVEIPNNHPVKRGLMVEVGSNDNLPARLDNLLSVLSRPVSKAVHFSLPHWDSVGKGLVIRLTRAVESESGVLLGVAGLDVPLGALAEDVTYFGHPPSSYAFLVDADSGMALMHPSLPRPAYAQTLPMHTELWHLEPHLTAARKSLLSDFIGEETVEVKGSPLLGQTATNTIQYNWQRVPGTPYVVCVAKEVSRNEHKGALPAEGPPEQELDIAYHRLDLLPSKNLCRHFKQLSTLETSTVFLSASCFLSPFEYLSQEESRQTSQSYMAYLTDTTKLIANPGLKSGVRSELLAIAPITKLWKEKAGEDFSKYVVRRFVATQSGVFITYPGTVLEKTFDPSKRDWFLRALEFPVKVVLSAPYLDPAGAGYIITLSVTLFEGKYASMHGPSDRVVGVMGMDLTLGYFFKLLLNSVSICEQERITCFLMDDRGYLVAHPGLVEPNGRPASEQLHITHKEPLVASDILNHKAFARKEVCNYFSDRSVQRFYQFNSSLEGSLTNLVHGESCAKYIITAVPGTNVFLGIVNQTCDVTTTFCPCSTTDRLCLNCHRMEQTECECPCECPLEVNLCSGHLPETQEHIGCPRLPEDSHLAPVSEKLLEPLQACNRQQCTSHPSRRDCLGLQGCEWCQVDSDGVTVLRRPFCTDHRKCFGGVLGSRTPYADEILGLPSEEYLWSKNSPVGPVTAGIICCFLLLAVAFYLYRHQQASQRLHGTSSEFIAPRAVASHLLNSTPHQDNAGNMEDDIPHPGHSNVVLANFENMVVPSPYRMAGYRRRAGGDSDPGYSTMTPHDDCETVPSIEPLLLGNRDRHKVAPSSTSGCSRASSPGRPLTPPPNSNRTSPLWITKQGFPEGQTVIPKVPHAVLAQVQVHVADVR